MTHPARQIPFDELCAALQSAISAGHVHEQAKGDLRLYCYTKSCVYERAWTPITMIARGLILDLAARTVVATPFPKFFNIGERAENDNWPTLPFETFEKVDGSLIIIFWHGGRWQCATKGSFNSEQAQKAQAILDDTAQYPLKAGVTYLAEYVGPDNRIVVPYEKSELVLLGAYAPDGEEASIDDLQYGASCLRWRAATSHHYASVADLVATMPTLPANQEGFVLRFSNGLRLKVKGDEYKRIHALISHCTPLAMWEAMRDGTDLEALRCDLPEEFLADFDAIREALTDRLSEIRIQTSDTAKQFENMSDKEVGLRLRELSQTVRPFVFPYRKGTLDSPRVRDVLFRIVRPTGNKLPNYTPSYAVNRAMDEAA